MREEVPGKNSSPPRGTWAKKVWEPLLYRTRVLSRRAYILTAALWGEVPEIQIFEGEVDARGQLAGLDFTVGESLQVCRNGGVKELNTEQPCTVAAVKAADYNVCCLLRIPICPHDSAVLFSSTRAKTRSVCRLPFSTGENYMETNWKLGCDD